MDQRSAFEARAKEEMVMEEHSGEEDGDLDENAFPDSDLHVVIGRERMLRMEGMQRREEKRLGRCRIAHKISAILGCGP
jgi:hypothetical protein